MSGLPEAVVQMQIAANGDAGRAWLAALPRLIDELCERWSITDIGPAYEGGCVAYVAPVALANGAHAVLKLCLLDDETEREADALALWEGNGAVQLLKCDRSRGAMLLECVEPGTSLAQHPDRDDAIRIACSLLRRLWIEAPASHPFRLVTDFAQRCADTFPVRHIESGHTLFAERTLARTVALCREFANVHGPRVIANRDFHLGNVLASQREPWLAIDPKPLAGEPAFDAAHLVRSLLGKSISTPELERLISTIAGLLELPAQRVAGWILVRSMEDAFWCVDTGAGDPQWDVACVEAVERSCHLL